MNDPNEDAVIRVFSDEAPGAWLTVQAIRAYLSKTRATTERTLYRVLRRLVKRGILVNTPTQDRGALYALAPARDESQDLVRGHPVRGRLAVGVSAPLRVPGQWTPLGTVTIPPGVTRIKQLVVSVKHCRGPFLGAPDRQGRRYCVTDRRPHFDVSAGPLPKVCQAMLRREDGNDSRTVQCGLPPRHSGPHEVPPAWRTWWETGKNVPDPEPESWEQA